MGGKRAVIVAELVGESREKSNDVIATELFVWFTDEVLAVPWVKEVKKVVVQKF
ncbi:hypothetical protein JXA31_01570 [Candidatus Bathyarchaeota archaeon]|nr:hypothetical protein [Candidatus Bathyarchaeota archaeon]